jgi:hypothetical protein
VTRDAGSSRRSHLQGQGYITSKIEMLAPLSFTGQSLAISTASSIDPAATARGSGLQGMADRLSALAGEIEISSRPAGGTVVVGRIPVEKEGEEDSGVGERL